MFYSDVFAKVRFTERALPCTLDRWHHCQITNHQTLGVFYNWGRLHLTSGPVQVLKSSKSNWLEREVHQGGLFCPKTPDEEEHLGSIPFSLSDHLFLMLTPCRSSWFFCSLFSLPWPEKVIPFFLYLRQLQKRVIKPPMKCWVCQDTSDPVFSAHYKLLPDFQRLSFS